MRISRLRSAIGPALLLALLPAFTAQSAIPQTERQALVELYDATIGSSWTRSDGWLGNAGSECSWYGVHCDQTESTVLELTLEENNLNGTIPSSIGQLTGLVELFLYTNQLTGSIPPELAQLQELERLDLSQNRLTGPIPPGLGDLIHLTELYLQMNQLSGSIPPELGQLTNVGELGLWVNLLTGSIPAELGQMSSLEFLVLGANPLNGPIPPELGQLTNLTRLYLGDSGINGQIPKELGQLTNLQLLHLGQTDLSGPIPAELGQLVNLEGLNLGKSRLSGEIPSSFLNLTKLPDASEAVPPFFVLDLAYAALQTSDPALDAFLDSKHLDGNWSATQTIPPEDVRVLSTTASSVTLGWTPIEYSQDAGAYDAFMSDSESGPFNPVISTSDKTTSQVTITGLPSSTTWFFKVRAATDPHPPFNVHRVESDFSEVISATTGGGTPQVVVTRPPDVLVQEAGTGGATTTFALMNTGTAGTTITLLKENGEFFDQTPASFSLDPSGVQVVTVTGFAQAEGVYEGTSVATGSGADGITIPVRLLSQAPPATGTPVVVTRTPRIDVATSGDEQVSGKVTLENVGTATARGLVDADRTWLSLPGDVITIEEGETVDIDFTIEPAGIPEGDFESGDLAAIIAFTYLDSGSQPTGKLAELGSTSGNVSTTTSTLLVTPVIGSQSSAIPPLAQDEVALFIAGVRKLSTSGIGFSTDLRLTNLDEATDLDAVDLYYRPVEATQSPSKGTTGVIPLARSTTFGDAFGALGIESGTGSMVLRSGGIEQLRVDASQIAKKQEAGAVGRTPLPVFRSDRAAGIGESIVLSGLRTDPPYDTEVFIQEARGVSTSVSVTFRDDDGSLLGEKALGIEPFGLARLDSATDPFPAGTASASISVETGGAAVGYAITANPGTGSSWITTDWRIVYGSPSSQPSYAPVAGNVGGTAERRRSVGSERVIPGVDVRRASELVMENTGSADMDISVTYRSIGRRFVRTIDLSLGPLEAHDLSNVVEGLFGRGEDRGGILEIEAENPDQLAVNGNNYIVTDPDARVAIPVIPWNHAFGAGNHVTFFGLEDSDSGSIRERAPGTVRTTLGVAEVGGDSAVVRVSVYFTIPGALAAPVGGPPIAAREIDLGPGDLQSLHDLVRSVVGSSRDQAYGYLRNVTAKVEVVSGRGRILPFVWMVDNASGELIVPIR